MVTLGPKGRNVVLGKKWGLPMITNNGVSIAKKIELSDPLEKLGAYLAHVGTKTSGDARVDPGPAIHGSYSPESSARVIAKAADPADFTHAPDLLRDAGT